MRMLVLAGGFGTRLREAVADVPKPLAPVGAQPFLYFQVEHWIECGVRSFVFLLHHEADKIIAFLDEHRAGLLAACEVTYLVEPSPLDTGGAVAYAVQTLDLRGSFLVANADTWIGTGFEALWDESPNVIAVIRQENVARYGQVDFDVSRKITAFREKGAAGGAGWINAGVCLLAADCFRPWDGKALSLEKDVFPGLLAKGELKALTLSTDFIDIGIPEDYRQFCRWQEAGRREKLCN